MAGQRILDPLIGVRIPAPELVALVPAQGSRLLALAKGSGCGHESLRRNSSESIGFPAEPALARSGLPPFAAPFRVVFEGGIVAASSGTASIMGVSSLPWLTIRGRVGPFRAAMVTKYTATMNRASVALPSRSPKFSVEGLTCTVTLASQDLVAPKFFPFRKKAFLDHGVSIYAIRRAAETAAQIFSVKHPFCVKRFETDGRSVIARIVDEVGEERMLDLIRRQHVFTQLFNPRLRRLDYDLGSGNASRWWPLGKEKPVVLDPGRALGAAIVVPSDWRGERANLREWGTPAHTELRPLGDDVRHLLRRHSQMCVWVDL